MASVSSIKPWAVSRFGPCAIFPFAFAHTPEGIAVSLSPICGSTLLGLGVAPLDREDDLRERLMQAEPRRADGYRLAPGVEALVAELSRHRTGTA